LLLLTGCYWADQIEEGEVAGHEALMGDMRSAYKILDGKSEETRPLGRPVRREDDIKMEF
jgi:hypothetical protein